MFKYEQSTGRLFQGSALVGVGYSGHGRGRNNPDMQEVHNIGPLPEGLYTIMPPRDTETHGPYVLPLAQDGPPASYFNRSGFLIHGDNVRHDASEGCIIMLRQVRERIWNSDDRMLQVVRSLPDPATLVAGTPSSEAQSPPATSA